MPKVCKEEGCENPIWSRKTMRCKYHQPIKSFKNKPPKSRIKPISDKRLEELAKYRIIREQYMKLNSKCELCTEKATEIHHKNSRENERLYDDKYFMSICRVCHIKIHEHPKWARENGYLI